MLGTLKQRISSIQEGITSTVLGSTSGPNIKELADRDKINLEAGSELLEQYQAQWQLLHQGGEQAAKQADRCDRLVSQLHAEYEKQWRHVAMLSSLVLELPGISNRIQLLLTDLATIQHTFSEVELSLLTLEETLDAREAQEKLLEQRFQVSLYQERRRHELLELETRLEADFQKRMQEREKKEVVEKRERQTVFQSQFEADMERFRQTGFLEVPLTRGAEVSLESVNLSEDEDELEGFLNHVDTTDDPVFVSSPERELGGNQKNRTSAVGVEVITKQALEETISIEVEGRPEPRPAASVGASCPAASVGDATTPAVALRGDKTATDLSENRAASAASFPGLPPPSRMQEMCESPSIYFTPDQTMEFVSHQKE